MIPLSVIDFCPIPEGGDVAQSFRNTLDLARHAERWGYERFWLAEHHGRPGLGCAATAVLINHVANGTKTIRVGAGGIILPYHSPLVVAETFGTLELLHPGRIDLGLGRAPGTDQALMLALRRGSDVFESFPRDVTELMGYFSNEPGPLRAVPGGGLAVPVWILGSSLFGAKLAANLGLPYAFASHFEPAQLAEAVSLYRATFRPSARLARPYVLLGFNVFAADSDEEAQLLASSMQQAFVTLISGRLKRLQPPVKDYLKQISLEEREFLNRKVPYTAIGSPETVAKELSEFVTKTRPDELMIASQIYDHAARLRSYEIVAGVRGTALGSTA